MLHEFLKVASQRMQNYPNERTGQAFMNALWYYSPEIHEKVYRSGVDCFYNDANVPAFLAEVAYHIEVEQRNKMEDGQWPATARSIWPDGEQV